MNNLKMVAGIVGLVSLLSVIIATPAMAQDCTTRPLDQGSGNVKICVVSK